MFNKKINSASALLFFFFIPALILPQHGKAAISGYIKDKITGKPIPNADVYIANSTFGSSTNEKGFFKIYPLSPGKYNLIAAAVGYKVETEYITIIDGKNYRRSFSLEQKIYEFPTVVIAEKEDEQWRQNYEIFSRELIGTSPFAEETKITNPYQINFSEKDDALFASAPKPIHIINNALGYEIIYFLQSFEYEEPTVKFVGVPVYKELKPKDANEKNKWNANRRYCYCGSFRHFLNTLSRDYDFLTKIKNQDSLNIKSITERNGFTVAQKEERIMAGAQKIEDAAVDILKIVYRGALPGEKLLVADKPIYVTYDRKWEEDELLDFIGVMRQSEEPNSRIVLHKPAVSFDNQGRYWDKLGIELFGYWAYERLADSLPFDYSLPEDYLESADFK